MAGVRSCAGEGRAVAGGGIAHGEELEHMSAVRCRHQSGEEEGHRGWA